jgi:putative DNA primase/helicase
MNDNDVKAKRRADDDEAADAAEFERQCAEQESGAAPVDNSIDYAGIARQNAAEAQKAAGEPGYHQVKSVEADTMLAGHKIMSRAKLDERKQIADASDAHDAMYAMPPPALDRDNPEVKQWADNVAALAVHSTDTYRQSGVTDEDGPDGLKNQLLNSLLSATSGQLGWVTRKYEAPERLSTADRIHILSEIADKEIAATVPGKPEPYCDLDFAGKLVDEHAQDVFFTWGEGWYEWKDDRWQRGTADAPKKYAQEICTKAGDDLKKLGLKSPPTPAFLHSLGDNPKHERIVSAARYGLTISLDRLDAQPMLLGVPGGVIDLLTGKPRRQNRPRPGAPIEFVDYVTKRTVVAPDKSGCPRWLDFLREVLPYQPEVIEFLKQYCGYSLTGLTTEQKMLFLYGPGGNGKGVFVHTITSILGDEYAINVPSEVLMATKTGEHPQAIARLRGGRLATSTEVEEGRDWNEARIKLFTGGDKLTAHHMHKDDFTFQPNFKLIISGNHQPSLKTVDKAIKRRLLMVPFMLEIADKDVDLELEEKLKGEWPGILAWMIEGCLAWRKAGRLIVPQSIVEETDEYLYGQDTVGRWFEERCEQDEHTKQLEEKGGQCFHDYEAWAKREGITNVKGSRDFAAALRRIKGVTKPKHTRKGNFFKGFRLKPFEFSEELEG